jgi:hypothetical protein
MRCHHRSKCHVGAFFDASIARIHSRHHAGNLRRYDHDHLGCRCG